VHGGVDWTELSEKLNPSFDWEGEIQDVIGLDISLHKVYRYSRIQALTCFLNVSE